MSIHSDRLLFLTRLALTILLGLTVVAAVASLIGIPLLWAARGALLPEMIQSGFHAESLPWLSLILAAVAIWAVLGFFFLRLLRRIVDSVSEGDPFIPVNADRLRAMAWLSLAIQAVVFVMTPLLIWFDSMPHKANVHYGDTGLSFGSLILALLLFVLARVFRVGAEMRAELEGTV